MKKLFTVVASFIIFQTSFLPTAHANYLVSPYYRYFLPKRVDNEQPKILNTLTYKNERIAMFTKERSHQFGIKLETFGTDSVPQVSTTTIQAIERRPFTARRSLSDDGLIFQYWERNGLQNSYKVLFGYTTDKKVSYVQLNLRDGVKRLKLYDGRYFVCVLKPIRDRSVVAQGIASDGKVLRTWNGHFDYHARRTWLSFFVQTYPFEVRRH